MDNEQELIEIIHDLNRMIKAMREAQILMQHQIRYILSKIEKHE